MMIHALSVLEGILAISPLPGDGGDFAGDMAHVTEWRPAIVITLVNRAEMEAADASRLGVRVRDHGSRWLHLPIPDFGTPPEEMRRLWPEVSAQARQALSGGGRVLVHCRGGCGRSGMVALRLMIEAGEAPDEALARLRHLRPCAVETDAQMDWAMEAPRVAALFLRHVD